MQSAPKSIEEAVNRELQGERILWSASPDQWAYASKDWKKAVMGIPFTAFALFWTYQVAHIPSRGHDAFATFFPLWGLMFVGFGLSMLLSPLLAAWTAKSVYYVVTETRAVIFEKKFKLKIQSFNQTSVANFERVSSGDQGGSIIFQKISERSGRGTKITEIGFIGLSDYAGAERALKQLLARA